MKTNFILGLLSHMLLLMTFRHGGQGLQVKSHGLFALLLVIAAVAAIAAGMAGSGLSSAGGRVIGLVLLAAICAYTMWELYVPVLLISTAADLLFIPVALIASQDLWPAMAAMDAYQTLAVGVVGVRIVREKARKQ